MEPQGIEPRTRQTILCTDIRILGSSEPRTRQTNLALTSTYQALIVKGAQQEENCSLVLFYQYVEVNSATGSEQYVALTYRLVVAAME